jgi:hypothetical protein
VRALVAMVGMLLVLPQRASAGALWVSLPSPSEPCTSAQVADAIHLRRPTAEVREGRTPGPDDLWAEIDQGAAGWSLTVHAPGKGLRRPLPPRGADCVDLSETAALMLDRFLEELRWSDRAPQIEKIVHLPPPPPVPVQAVVELGPAAGLGGLGGQLELSARRAEVQLGLSGAGWLGTTAPVSTTDAGVGTYAVQRGQLEAVGGYRLALGPGTLRLEAAGGAQLLRAAASGPLLFHRQAQTAVSPTLGARAGYELGLPWALAVALRAQGRALLAQTTFQTVGYDGTVRTRRLEGELVLSLSRTLW